MSILFVLLTLQVSAALISLAGTILVIAVVVFLMASSSSEEDKYTAKHKVYKVRGRYFFALVFCITVLLIVSLRLLPYPNNQMPPGNTVTVVGAQWSWKLAPGEFNKKVNEFAGKNEITLPVNANIKFVVTSVDVNHSMGIYNSKGDLMIQTQAMPQYKNELQFKFQQPGDYHILCLEYCGLVHANMAGIIHVQ